MNVPVIKWLLCMYSFGTIAVLSVYTHRELGGISGGGLLLLFTYDDLRVV